MSSPPTEKPREESADSQSEEVKEEVEDDKKGNDEENDNEDKTKKKIMDDGDDDDDDDGDDDDEDEDDDDDEDEDDHDDDGDDKEGFYYFAKMKRPKIIRNVATALFDFTTPGSFATSGFLTTSQAQNIIDSMALCMSGCRIDGIDVLFPMSADLIKTLHDKGVLTAAPFGKGSETVLDPTVRKTLQVDPKRITFSNPGYPTAVQTLAKRVAHLLGISDTVPVHANLHKMLVYQQGDFFTTHRDSVHEPNMIGTLVVQPPSIYTGGKLVVTHGTSTYHLDLSDAQIAPFAVGFTAFYADCEHSVETLTSGIRVVFVYNLVCGAASEMPTVIPPHIENQQKTDALRDAVNAWYNSVKEGSSWQIPPWKPSKSTSPILACVCEHLYAKSIVSSATDPLFLMSTLKGVDQSRFLALSRAVSELGLTKQVGLGIAFLNGETTNSYDDNSYHDETFTIAAPALGNKSGIQNFSVVSSKTVLTEAENALLFHIPYAEYTGNEGQAEEHKYEFSAIVMWDLSKTNLIKYDLIDTARSYYPEEEMVKAVVSALKDKEIESLEERRDLFHFAGYVQTTELDAEMALRIVDDLDWLDCHKQFEDLIRGLDNDHEKAVKCWLQFIPVEIWDTKLKYLKDCKMWLFEDKASSYIDDVSNDDNNPLSHWLEVAESLGTDDASQSFMLTHALPMLVRQNRIDTLIKCVSRILELGMPSCELGAVDMVFDVVEQTSATFNTDYLFTMMANLLKRGNVNDPLFRIAIESITKLDTLCRNKNISVYDYGKHIQNNLRKDKALVSLAARTFVEGWMLTLEKQLDDKLFTWTFEQVRKDYYNCDSKNSPIESVPGFKEFLTGSTQQFMVTKAHMKKISEYCTRDALHLVECETKDEANKDMVICEKQKQFGLGDQRGNRSLLDELQKIEWKC